MNIGVGKTKKFTGILLLTAFIAAFVTTGAWAKKKLETYEAVAGNHPAEGEVNFNPVALPNSRQDPKKVQSEEIGKAKESKKNQVVKKEEEPLKTKSVSAPKEIKEPKAKPVQKVAKKVIKKAPEKPKPSKTQQKSNPKSNSEEIADLVVATQPVGEEIQKPVIKKQESTILPTGQKVIYYDPVPMDHIDSIVGRLKLVEQILVDYGRAYDYRAHTTKELNAILASLEKFTAETSQR